MDGPRVRNASRKCTGSGVYPKDATEREVALICEGGVTGTALVTVDPKTGSGTTIFKLSNGEEFTFSY